MPWYSVGMKATRSIGLFLGYILGVYLIGRAFVEPFIMDYHHPESYRQLWGGPSLAGVMAVHILPGAISAVLIYRRLRRVRSEHRKPF
jgi:hypothetical protein